MDDWSRGRRLGATLAVGVVLAGAAAAPAGANLGSGPTTTTGADLGSGPTTTSADPGSGPTATAAPTRADLAARAAELGFGAIAQRVAADALPGARLQVGGSGAVGGSRLGGRPDLPPGMAWPRCRGRRLSFLAQLRLADVAALSPGTVPASGVLSVFADLTRDRDGMTRIVTAFGRVGRASCVVVRRLRGPIVRRDVPAGVRRLHSRPVRLRPTLTIPDFQVAETRYGLDFDTAFDAWNELADEAADGPLAPSRRYVPRHQVLGWPMPIQETPVYGCGRHPLPAPAYRLLLQIDDDDRLGFTFGDAPTFYLTGRPADLRAGRFGRLCAEFQDS